MIARLYVLDSLTYPEEASYWLNYAFKLAYQMFNDCPNEKAQDTQKILTNLKRCQAMQCAWLID